VEFSLRETLMSEYKEISNLSLRSSGDLDRSSSPSDSPDGRFLIAVQVVEGLSVVVIQNAEELVDPDAIRSLSTQLHCLIEEGHTRLLLDFEGVQRVSAGVLGILASLHRRLEHAQTRLGLCGLDPVMRQMIRICHLEPVFDIYTDSTAALGVSSGARIQPRPESSRTP
jgi:anti-anti-sigma factor